MFCTFLNCPVILLLCHTHLPSLFRFKLWFIVLSMYIYIYKRERFFCCHTKISSQKKWIWCYLCMDWPCPSNVCVEVCQDGFSTLPVLRRCHRGRWWPGCWRPPSPRWCPPPRPPWWWTQLEQREQGERQVSNVKWRSSSEFTLAMTVGSWTSRLCSLIRFKHRMRLTYTSTKYKKKIVWHKSSEIIWIHWFGAFSSLYCHLKDKIRKIIDK